MHTSIRRVVFVAFVFFFSATLGLQAQSNSGFVGGSVTDPSGAAVPGATVSIQNPVSGYFRSVISDTAGHFQFTNLPFNSYHLSVSANGFGSVTADALVASTVPVDLI